MWMLQTLKHRSGVVGTSGFVRGFRKYTHRKFEHKNGEKCLNQKEGPLTVDTEKEGTAMAGMAWISPRACLITLQQK